MINDLHDFDLQELETGTINDELFVCEEPDMTVDKALLTNGQLQGFRDGKLVLTFAGAEDYSHIELFDKDGNIVPHEQWDELTLLEAKVKELVEKYSRAAVNGLFEQANTKEG